MFIQMSVREISGSMSDVIKAQWMISFIFQQFTLEDFMLLLVAVHTSSFFMDHYDTRHNLPKALQSKLSPWLIGFKLMHASNAS